MSDRYVFGTRVLGGLLFLAAVLAASATASAASVLIVAMGVLAVGAALATAVHWPRRPSVRRCWGPVAAVGSGAVTAGYRGPVANATGWWWILETFALLALLVPTVRRTDGRSRRAVFAGVLGAAVVALPLRIGPRMAPPADPAETEVLCLVWFLLAVGAVVCGGYLRALDSGRRRAIAEQRRQQRLEVARDLHDFASHDVMGVVVLVQAARLLAREDPARAVGLLPRIEEAGTQALAAMDRTVCMLNEDGEREPDVNRGGDRDVDRGGERDGQPGGDPVRAGRPPVEGPARAQSPRRARHRRRDLSELPELAARFTRTGTVPATLNLRGGALDELPREVSATGYRIVVESLTNVRRHAPAAVAVEIAAHRVAHRDGDALRITVTDTGPTPAVSASPLSRRPRGGAGLTGLTDRVEALGGSLAAGPHGNVGWQVSATLPLPGSAVPADRPHERTGLDGTAAERRNAS